MDDLASMLDSLSGQVIDASDDMLLVKGLLQTFGTFDRILELSTRQLEARHEGGVNKSEDPSVFLFSNEVAPIYGVLTSGALRIMDDELKVAVAGTARALARLGPDQRGWTDMMNILMSNPVLEPCTGNAVDRADTLLVDRKNWLKKSEQYDSVVKEVQAWFTKLIVDPDILSARSSIDLSVVSDIVAHAGNTMDRFVIEKKHEEKTLLDIGILRYPDFESPYIKVYRIKLFAWYKSKMILGHAHDRNGISGQFNSRSFRPKRQVIAGIEDAARARAIAEANQLFS